LTSFLQICLPTSDWLSVRPWGLATVATMGSLRSRITKNSHKPVYNSKNSEQQTNYPKSKKYTQIKKCKKRTKLYLEFHPNDLPTNNYEKFIHNIFPNQENLEAVSSLKPGVCVCRLLGEDPYWPSATLFQH
jgi:hypothetical protein